MNARYHSFTHNANREHAWLLLLALALICGTVGWVLAGSAGFVWAMLLAAAIALFAPRMPPRTLMRLYNARVVQPQEIPGVYDVLADMSRRAGLEYVPSLYLIPAGYMNAFAVGDRQDAAIAVTSGLLNRLDLQELAAVLAHEVSHIIHDDIRVMTLADIFTRLTSIFSTVGKLLVLINLPLMLLGEVVISWWLVLVLLAAPLISVLLQLALSRTREFAADESAAKLSGDPAGLARALLQLEQYEGSWFSRILFPGRKSMESPLLRSHPVTEERVARLKAMVHESWARPRYVVRYGVPRSQFRIRSPRWRLGRYWFGI